MFLLVPAYPGCPGQTAVKWLLLLLCRPTMKETEKYTCRPYNGIHISATHAVANDIVQKNYYYHN